jgi:copper chaperone CopZ
MVFFLIKYKNHMILALILVVLLVVIFLLYYLSKSEDISQQTPSQPNLPSLPPIREVEVFLDDTIAKTIQVRTKKDLEDEIEKAVDRVIASVDHNQQQIIDTEQLIIDTQKEKVEQLRLEAEREAEAKEAEMAAKKKRFDDMINQRREELLMKRRKMEEERAAKLLLEREKERLNKEKQLAELKLARQKVQQELEAAQKVQSDREKSLKEEELRLLEEARQKAEEDRIKAEEEAAELQKRIEMKQVEARVEEAKIKQQMEEAKAEQTRMEEEYEARMAEQALKVEEANADLEELLVAEKERQVQMDADNERLRQEETQRLLDANEEALRELEEAEAEQARMDAEEAEARRQFEMEATAAEDAQRAETMDSQAEYDARVAADQVLLDTQVDNSERTGDAEQRAERQEALDLEAQSEIDASRVSEEEQQRDREAAEKLAADSEAGGTVAVDGVPLAFDYDAYMRGDPIPCTVTEWTDWAKVGDLVEETETVVTISTGPRGGTSRSSREVLTGRWQQRWKREREVLSPPLNGGRCVFEEMKYTTQASKNCEDSDWNEWRNIGEPFEERVGDIMKWYQKRERDRRTEVVPDGCNLRIDTMNKEIEPQPCKYSQYSAWRNVGSAYEQTRRRSVGRQGSGTYTEKTGKWVINQEATRTVVEQPKFGGLPCSDESLKKTREVELDPVHCVVGQWGPWRSRGSDRISTSCSGRGVYRRCTDTHFELQKRNRFISTHPAYGGNGCPSLEEHRDVERPKTNCYLSWGQWQNNGPSTRSCGKKGRNCKTKQPQVRHATIITHPAYGGNACGPTTETRKINV